MRFPGDIAAAGVEDGAVTEVAEGFRITVEIEGGVMADFQVTAILNVSASAEDKGAASEDGDLAAGAVQTEQSSQFQSSFPVQDKVAVLRAGWRSL